jgi:DNA-binding MurR/RpiR family transcriptional regulator
MEESMSKQSSFEPSNNNVVMFPGPRVRTIIPIEESAAREAAQRAYVDEVTESYATHLANKLGQQGFDVFTKEFDKHFGFTMEAFRATLLKSMGLSHPFHEMVEAAVEAILHQDDDEEDPA